MSASIFGLPSVRRAFYTSFSGQHQQQYTAEGEHTAVRSAMTKLLELWWCLGCTAFRFCSLKSRLLACSSRRGRFLFPSCPVYNFSHFAPLDEMADGRESTGINNNHRLGCDVTIKSGLFSWPECRSHSSSRREQLQQQQQQHAQEAKACAATTCRVGRISRYFV